MARARTATVQERFDEARRKIDRLIAEGATGPFFECFVLLSNPNNVAANVERSEKTREMGIGITKPGVGPNGETLDALQELTRLGVLRQTRRRARVFLDVNGYRAQRREQLSADRRVGALRDPVPVAVPALLRHRLDVPRRLQSRGHSDVAGD